MGQQGALDDPAHELASSLGAGPSTVAAVERQMGHRSAQDALAQGLASSRGAAPATSTSMERQMDRRGVLEVPTRVLPSAIGATRATVAPMEQQMGQQVAPVAPTPTTGVNAASPLQPPDDTTDQDITLGTGQGATTLDQTHPPSGGGPTSGGISPPPSAIAMGVSYIAKKVIASAVKSPPSDHLVAVVRGMLNANKKLSQFLNDKFRSCSPSFVNSAITALCIQFVQFSTKLPVEQCMELGVFKSHIQDSVFEILNNEACVDAILAAARVRTSGARTSGSKRPASQL